jgi:hypothetical protein
MTQAPEDVKPQLPARAAFTLGFLWDYGAPGNNPFGHKMLLSKVDTKPK